MKYYQKENIRNKLFGNTIFDIITENIASIIRDNTKIKFDYYKTAKNIDTSFIRFYTENLRGIKKLEDKIFDINGIRYIYGRHAVSDVLYESPDKFSDCKVIIGFRVERNISSFDCNIHVAIRFNITKKFCVVGRFSGGYLLPEVTLLIDNSKNMKMECNDFRYMKFLSVTLNHNDVLKEKGSKIEYIRNIRNVFNNKLINKCLEYNNEEKAVELIEVLMNNI